VKPTINLDILSCRLLQFVRLTLYKVCVWMSISNSLKLCSVTNGPAVAPWLCTNREQHN